MHSTPYAVKIHGVEFPIFFMEVPSQLRTTLHGPTFFFHCRERLRCRAARAASPSPQCSGIGISSIRRHAGVRRVSDTRVASTNDVSMAPEGEEAPTAKGSGSEVVKLLLIAFALVSVLLYGSGSLQGLKASANKSILGRSGFLAAFSLIFLSELGDKTFFIAGLLATRVGKWRSLIGSTGALAIMTVISVSIGSAFNSLPEVLKSSLPIGQYLGAALMLLFGLRTIKDSLGSSKGQEDDDAELHEAELSVSSAEREGKMTQRAGLWQTLLQVGTLIFLAEWGDRSMLATIALGASHPPLGVAFGATLAHAVATGIAVVGGAYVSKYISERTIGLIGGSLFLIFAALTMLGYF